MTDLLALEKRLGEAGEGSRELDALIAISLEAAKYVERDPKAKLWPGVVGVKNDIVDNGLGYTSCCDAPKYTTSLDAALALAERKLTECGKSHADILNWILEAMEEVGSGNIVSAFALAVCLALVRALAHNPAVEK